MRLLARMRSLSATGKQRQGPTFRLHEADLNDPTVQKRVTAGKQLKLEPWEPEVQRTVTVPYTWKADTWYHLKLRVENTADGKVRADLALVCDQRGRSLVAGGLEPEDHGSAGSRHMISASSRLSV